MKTAIENRITLDVDLLPNRDVIYSGICLKNNYEVYIYVCFNSETKEFDGYAIVRSQEIEHYRYWDKEELSSIKNDNRSDFFDKLPLEKMNTFYECLYCLRDKELVAIFTNEDDDSYYVGKIEKLTDKTVTLLLISESSEWINTKVLKIKDINYIGFDSNYEKNLMKNLLRMV